MSVTLLVGISTEAFGGVDAMAGKWSGMGSMKPSDGPREKIHCKVAYDVKRPGKSMKLDLKCASDAYKLMLSADIEQDGANISGNWFESEWRQGGKIVGTNSGDLVEARIEGNTVAALVTIRTTGNRQWFVMDAPGSWVSQVSIELKREAP
ncbi:hypothetical protein [Bradyrhizobium sp. CCGUVB14]|uniref:hypothetical protein n=1 Tax=Bradyrhizobium sp. CCGUVB14 TaxID=2949628 RepID=UPI0020B31C56|nr:hypothetical protein [Bradyrhizobium sp. CCGUVB14]MCP3446079.1 hypothetical protein [Bradyrhizobium sp. CCGUVB14]